MSLNINHISSIYDDGYIQFVAEDMNAIFRINSDKKTISIWKMLPSVSGKFEEFRSCFFMNGSMYVIPYNGGVMLEYGKNRSMRRIYLNEGSESLKMTGCIERDDSLYIYGDRNMIFKYGISIDDISVLNVDLGFEHYFWTKSVMVNNDIYIPFTRNNVILKISNDDRMEYMQLGKFRESWSLFVVEIYNNNIYALYRDNDSYFHSSVYSMNGEKISDSKIIFDRSVDMYPYTHAFFNGNKWIILPYKYSKPEAIGLDGGMVESDYLKCKGGRTDVQRIFNAYTVCGRYLYSVDQLSEELLELNLEKNEYSFFKLKTEKKGENYLRGLYEDNFNIFIKETNEHIELADFIKFVMS